MQTSCSAVFCSGLFTSRESLRPSGEESSPGFSFISPFFSVFIFIFVLRSTEGGGGGGDAFASRCHCGISRVWWSFIHQAHLLHCALRGQCPLVDMSRQAEESYGSEEEKENST